MAEQEARDLLERAEGKVTAMSMRAGNLVFCFLFLVSCSCFWYNNFNGFPPSILVPVLSVIKIAEQDQVIREVHCL